MWKKLLLACLAVMLLNPGCGCLNYLMYSTVPNMPRKTIKAETQALEDKNVAIVIYAPPSVHYEYPLARRRLMIRLAAELRERIDGASVVEPLRVLGYQDQNVNWDRLPRPELGRKFDADRLLYISLREYSLRERGSVNLYRGRLVAEAKVYDCTAADEGKLWQMEDLRVSFPKESEAGVPSADQRRVAAAVETLFVHKLVRSFYDHKIEADEEAAREGS